MHMHIVNVDAYAYMLYHSILTLNCKVLCLINRHKMSLPYVTLLGVTNEKTKE